MDKNHYFVSDPDHRFGAYKGRSWLTHCLCLMAVVTLAGCSTTKNDLKEPSSHHSIGSESSEAVRAQFGHTPVIEALGISADNMFSIDPEHRGFAKRELGINGRLQVVKVVPGSPADKAGLKPGDQLVQIGKKHIPKSESAYEFLASEVVADIQWGNQTSILVIRDGVARQLTLP